MNRPISFIQLIRFVLAAFVGGCLLGMLATIRFNSAAIQEKPHAADDKLISTAGQHVDFASVRAERRTDASEPGRLAEESVPPFWRKWCPGDGIESI